MRIKGLKHQYCHDCTLSLCRYKLKPGSIVPMCREDLDRFLHNGDYERANNIINKTAPRSRRDPERNL